MQCTVLRETTLQAADEPAGERCAARLACGGGLATAATCKAKQGRSVAGTCERCPIEPQVASCRPQQQPAPHLCRERWSRRDSADRLGGSARSRLLCRSRRCAQAQQRRRRRTESPEGGWGQGDVLRAPGATAAAQSRPLWQPGMQLCPGRGCAVTCSRVRAPTSGGMDVSWHSLTSLQQGGGQAGCCWACSAIVATYISAPGRWLQAPQQRPPTPGPLSQPLQVAQGGDGRRQLPQRVEAESQLLQRRQLADHLQKQSQGGVMASMNELWEDGAWHGNAGGWVGWGGGPSLRGRAAWPFSQAWGSRCASLVVANAAGAGLGCPQAGAPFRALQRRWHLLAHGLTGGSSLKMLPEAMSTRSCCSAARLAGSPRSAFWLSHSLCNDGPSECSESGRSSRPASLRKLQGTFSREVGSKGGW